MARRRCSVLYMLMSPFCRLCLCIGLIFATGFVVGVLLDEYIFSPTKRSGLVVFGRPDQTDEKSACGEGSGSAYSIKKDLKFQRKDYMPHNVFINCAVGPPNSLELFLETYPDSFMYNVYTFLLDPSYKPLYAKFTNHTLFPATLPASTNNTTTMDFPDMVRPGKMVSVPVVLIDFVTWLKESVHRDDNVVVKMCPDSQHVHQIMDSLIETATLEWVDKLYASSADSLSEFMKYVGNKFDAFRDRVYLWDDDMLTYSDFTTINQPANDGEETVEVTECQDNGGTEFTLLLYMSSLNQHAHATVNLLHNLAKKYPFPLPVTLFLPLEYVESKAYCFSLPSLGSTMEVGLYFSGSFLLTAAELMDEDKQLNSIRNKLVCAEHCFKYSEIILTYMLPEYVVLQSLLTTMDKKMKAAEDNKLFKQSIYERGYTLMADVKDLTNLVEKPSEDLKQTVENNENGLVAVDISMQGTDTLIFQLLSAHITSLIPAHICRMKGKLKA